MNASRSSPGSPNRGAWRVGIRSISLGPDADRVPVREYDTVPVAEQVSAVSVAVNHPVRELEAQLAVRVEKLIATVPQPAAFFLADGAAGLDCPADRDKRLVGRQRDRRWI